MAQSAAMVSGVAGRYATALFDLAVETNAVDAIASDVAALKAALGESDALAAALDDPSIARDALGAAMAALAEKLGVTATTQKFLGLMAAKRRLGALGKALDGFETLLAEQRGEQTVAVTAAAALSEDQQSALAAALGAASGKKIHMTVDIDPELIGGVVVKMGSKMIDASVRSKLTALQTAMKEAG